MNSEKISNTSKRLNYLINNYDIKQKDILEKVKPYCEKYKIRLEKNDLSQYVSDKTAPGQDKLSILAMALNVSEAWLLGYDVPMERGALLNEDITSIKVPLFTSILQNKGDNVLDYIYLPKERLNGQNADYFLYKVSGDNMAPKYLDGDIVLFKYNNMPKNNKDVLININDKETVFSKINIEEKSIKLNKYNPFYEDVTYTKDEMKKLNIKIIAEVQSLEYRDLRG